MDIPLTHRVLMKSNIKICVLSRCQEINFWGTLSHCQLVSEFENFSPLAAAYSFVVAIYIIIFSVFCVDDILCLALFYVFSCNVFFICYLRYFNYVLYFTIRLFVMVSDQQRLKIQLCTLVMEFWFMKHEWKYYSDFQNTWLHFEENSENSKVQWI